ncbi:hypothetical protein PsB1_0456 [Candidatus Phycosocius spiralis]|uniref:Uncharacterized protein n=1 Tax=Candidatus Phycosocius spiralis TaxID=2815099 RepID=A0ABQ4PTG1_9PROT|nr:hypothetical protein PsB1_0456 [Candidatus Phycosocius spiralis]
MAGGGLRRRGIILGGAGAAAAAGLGAWAWLNAHKKPPVVTTPPPPPPAVPIEPEVAPVLTPEPELPLSSVRPQLIANPLEWESPQAALVRGAGLPWRKTILQESVTPERWLAVRALTEPGFGARSGAGVLVSDAVLRAHIGERPLKDGPVVFAVRGARPPRPSNGFAQEYSLAIIPPDHLNFCCTIGVWDPINQEVSAYAASTVPNRTAIVSSALGVQPANMLLPGIFDYTPGSHSNYKKYGFDFAIVGALRQNGVGGGAGALPALRATTPTGMQGASVDKTMDDNIHCAETPLLEPFDRFSSEGCMVVAGRYTPEEGHSGPWARFLRDARFQDRSQVTVILVNSTALPVG